MRNINYAIGLLCLIFTYSCATEDPLTEMQVSPLLPAQAEVNTVQEVYDMISRHTNEIDLQAVEKLMKASGSTNNCTCFNASDLSDFLSCFGSNSLSCRCYDFDDNGFVGASDLSEFLSNFGACSPTVEDVDIAPWWVNWIQDINGQAFDIPLHPIVFGSECSWDDIKDNCCVEWYWTDILVSTDKTGLNLWNAIQNYGAFACMKYQPVTVRITHNPTGRIFERTNCGNYSHNLLGNANNQPFCDLGCEGFDLMATEGFEPFEFCINCTD